MAKRSITKGAPADDGLARIRKIFLALIVLCALAGLADATYLTAAHLSGSTAVCGESHGCSEVLGSRYASFHGIPTAAFGVIAYFTVFSATMLSLFGSKRARASLNFVVGAMFLVTLWFVYLQAYVIHAFCPYCLLSAGLICAITGLLLAYPTAR